jgi:dTDP-4-dehydrorhamnose reductase
MRWCVFGSSGQIGSSAISILSATNEVLAPSRGELDISQHSDVRNYILDTRPEIVLNAAAFTDVDASESRPELANLLNAESVGVISASCQKVGAKLIHISTDYVFDGMSKKPYSESDEAVPMNAYGNSKKQGEELALANNPATWVIRTSWVYRAGFHNFPSVVASKLNTGQEVRVVDDQYGAPTSATDLVAGLAQLSRTSAPFGVYHLTNQGQTSWFGFAQAVALALGFDTKMVIPTTTSEFVRPAKRPAYSVLSNDLWRARGLTPLPSWQDAWQRNAPAFASQHS